MNRTQSIVPAPHVDLDTGPFWKGAAQRKLKIGHCEECRTFFAYPRPSCPFCFGERVDLVDASGKGEIYSVTVMRRAQPPFALAYVRLVEGPSLMTNIVDCDLDALRIGGTVDLVFVPASDGALVPMFRPSAVTKADET